jgi:uncharacterized protein (TIGR00725 family)
LNKPIISVIGDTHMKLGGDKWNTAEELGEKLTTAGYRIMTGGLGDLPKAIATGARKSPGYTDGTLIAILPGFDPTIAQEYADIVIATGLDQARNLIVANSDAIVAIGGGGGTLSEIAYAWSLKRLIIAFDLPGWSGLLADKTVDNRIRYPEITEDKIFKVTNCDKVILNLKEYLPQYTKRHSGIRLKDHETASLLAKGYEENAEEDLAIAKDFETAENELDKNCDN